VAGTHRTKDWEIGLDAWAAGLFDGEGCIDLRRDMRKKCYGLRLRVSLKYPRPLYVLVGRYGGELIPAKWRGGRTAWVWHLHKAQEIDRVLRVWLPWLVEKRAQAEVGLKFTAMVARRTPRRVYSESEQRRCATWATRLGDLKRHQT